MTSQYIAQYRIRYFLNDQLGWKYTWHINKFHFRMDLSENVLVKSNANITMDPKHLANRQVWSSAYKMACSGDVDKQSCDRYLVYVKGPNYKCCCVITCSKPFAVFVFQRLKALDDGWEDVQRMWSNKQTLLSQSLNLQVFLRDAKQAEVLLSQQDNFLSKEEVPVSWNFVEKNCPNILLYHLVSLSPSCHILVCTYHISPPWYCVGAPNSAMLLMIWIMLECCHVLTTMPLLWLLCRIYTCTGT